MEYLKAIPVGCIGLSVNIGSGIILLGACDKTKKSQEEIDMAHGHTHGHQTQHFDYDDDDVNGMVINWKYTYDIYCI